MDKLALVVCTYKRQDLLKTLFDSICELTQPVWRVVVADNENSEETQQLISELDERLVEAWGSTEPDGRGFTGRAVWLPQVENTGGSGGFSAATQEAYWRGAEWFWLMDDDVAVVPEALERLEPWTRKYDLVQGYRYDYDGGPFYWQYRFSPKLGIYNPFATAKFDKSGSKPLNTICFEGGLFHRSVIDKVGFPDDNFFIYWDDCTFGYRASKVTRGVVVSDYILRRTREVSNVAIGNVRQLNSTSDNTRYYIVRNRGYMARYFKELGDYNRIGYGLGTALTFGKELARLVLVDRSHLASGFKRMHEGWRDSRAILSDPDWKPMYGPEAGDKAARN